MNLATRLSELRKAAGLNQTALAEQLHVSRQTISNWETGKSLPDIYSLIALSDLFALPLDDFIKGDAKLQRHLDPVQQLSPLFLAGSCLISFLTVVNGQLTAPGVDSQLRMALIIGQLLFTIAIAYLGRPYAKSCVTVQANGTKVITGMRLGTWLIYWANLVSTSVTTISGILLITV